VTRSGNNGRVKRQPGEQAPIGSALRRGLSQVLYPAGSAAPRARSSRRGTGADATLAGLAALAAFLMLHGSQPRLPGAAYVAIAATTVPLAVRRIWPLATFIVIVASTMLTSSYATAVTFAVVVFTAYHAVTDSRSRRAALLAVPAAGLVAGAAFPNTTPPLPGRLTAFLVLGMVVVAAETTQLWRRRAGDSQARIAGMTVEHQAATRRAIELERAQVASELHDVVTHNVSVMVVQAGAARQVLSAAPGEATAALLAVEASGRAAMSELRQLLGLLAPAGGIDAIGAIAEGEAGALHPQPGLGHLQALIDRVTMAGLHIDLKITGCPRALSPGADLAAYRIVQEALTNVMKHAGQARTSISIDYRPGQVIIEVTDDGSGSGARAITASPAGTGSAGTGRGLPGLRERVALYGGMLDAGRRAGGGWRVLAHLPADTPTVSVAGQ
jgi:signal transduction histidine kinase